MGFLTNFFSSMYTGKSGKGDFRKEDLPDNRFALFFEMLRINWSGIVKMNLLYVLFLLPTIAWGYIHLELLQQVGLDEFIQNYLSIFTLLMIPCFIISMIGRVGITYVLRNWARDEHSFVMSDFAQAVKTNWKQSLLLGFFNGVFLFLAVFAYRFYGAQVEINTFYVVPQTFMMVIGGFICLMNILLPTLMVTYDLKFAPLLKNSFILTLARFPFSLIVGILAILPVAIGIFAMLSVTYADLILIAYYLVIGFGLTTFIEVSYTNAILDKFINPRIQGAPVGLGLRVDIEQEEEAQDLSSLNNPDDQDEEDWNKV